MEAFNAKFISIQIYKKVDCWKAQGRKKIKYFQRVKCGVFIRR